MSIIEARTATASPKGNGVPPLAQTARTRTDRVFMPDGTAIQLELAWMTPGLATRYLAEFPYDKQRTSAQHHINFLAFEMLAGRFAVEAMYVVHHGDRGYLTDGAHRLKAIIESQVTLLVPVIHIFVDDFEQVASDYIRRDCGRGRTVSQAYAAIDLAASTELTDTQLNALGAACQVIIAGFSRKSSSTMTPQQRSRDVRRLSILDWAPEARAFFEATQGADPELRKALSRRAVMAVALVGFRYQPEHAVKFWNRVARNEGLMKGDAERTLVQFLVKYAAADRQAHEYARGVANAWNATFPKRQSLVLIKVPEPMSERPIHIEGTPYKGKETLILSYD